jgi:acyl-CoA synthetase (AMP-forming)/AMP-acid ligase II
VKIGATYVPCPLRAAAIAAPGAPAVVGADGTLTYGELDRRVAAAAGGIGELDLGAGARVALYLPKDENYFVLFLALIRAGCVACPLSTRLPPRGVAPLVRKISCRALISSDEELLEETDAGIQRLRPQRLLADEPAARDHLRGSEPLRVALDRPATTVFTSGSTGSPKAALQ